MDIAKYVVFVASNAKQANVIAIWPIYRQTVDCIIAAIETTGKAVTSKITSAISADGYKSSAAVPRCCHAGVDVPSQCVVARQIEIYILQVADAVYQHIRKIRCRDVRSEVGWRAV